MDDKIIEVFKGEFDRFFGMLEQQAEICPDDVWAAQAGGYPFWQQHLHVLATTILYARAQRPPFEGLPWAPPVMMLSQTLPEPISKADIKALAAKAKAEADAFINSQTTASLTQRHDGISGALGKEQTIQTALMALVRHLCYHLGACDAALRDKGYKGVY